jgi:hypothetical protein
LVYGIILLAVFVPIFMEMDLSEVFGLDEPLTTDTQAAFELAEEKVTAGAPVLMVFDYDASYMGELHSQARAMLQHLAQRQARIIAISLMPEGASLAQQLMDDVLSEQGYQAGQDFVNLGYLPGDAVGIRSLEFLPGQVWDKAFDGSDLKDAPILQGDEKFALSNMSLIMVLTGNPNDLRWWVEQTAAIEDDVGTDLILMAGVSSAIEALARPYYDMASPQIDGLVVGLMGAADYERALDLPHSAAHTRLSGQLVGQLAVFVLILIGMLIYGVARRADSDV